MANPKTGTVVLKDGAFLLEAEGKFHAIPVGPHTQPAQLKELAGKKVEILYSEPKSFIVGLVGGRVPILCYFPADPSLLLWMKERGPAWQSSSLVKVC